MNLHLSFKVFFNFRKPFVLWTRYLRIKLDHLRNGLIKFSLAFQATRKTRYFSGFPLFRVSTRKPVLFFWFFSFQGVHTKTSSFFYFFSFQGVYTCYWFALCPMLISLLWPMCIPGYTQSCAEHDSLVSNSTASISWSTTPLKASKSSLATFKGFIHFHQRSIQSSVNKGCWCHLGILVHPECCCWIFTDQILNNWIR